MSSEYINASGPIVVGSESPQVESPIVETNPPAPVVEAGELEPNHTNSPKWAIDRINELTAKRYAADREAKAAAERATTAEALVAQLSKQVLPANGEIKPQFTDEDIERISNEKAVQIARANEFNKTCDNIVAIGKREYTDWDLAVQNLTLVGALGKDVSPEFLETAVELKDPHKILHHLGKNLEEAERIAKLSPKRMAMEMARIEAQLAAPPAPIVVAPPPPVSQAPAPLIPVTGGAKPGEKSINDPDLSMEEFHLLRNKQAEERRNRYRRV